MKNLKMKAENLIIEINNYNLFKVLVCIIIIRIRIWIVFISLRVGEAIGKEGLGKGS